MEDRITVTVDEAGLQTIELLRLAARLGLMPARVRESVTALAKAGRVRVLNENPYVVVSAKSFKEAAAATAIAVNRFHETNSLVQGIGREELKARLFGDASRLTLPGSP